MAIAPRTAFELLRDTRDLQALNASELQSLAQLAEVRQVLKAGHLFREGEEAEGLYILRTGSIKLTKVGKDGREQIIQLVRPGRVIIEGVRFDEGSYPASAIAMRKASALLIRNELIWDLGKTRPDLLRTLLNIRARRTDKVFALIGDISLRKVPARLASFISRLVKSRHRRGEDSVNLVRDLTTETVAGRLGTVREEISRGLASLERAGALKVSTDIIEVVDLEHLENIASGKAKIK